MSDLPEGWVETTLGEVIDIYSGKTRPKQQGTYPVYGGNGILNYGDKFNQEGETIIVGRVGAYCGNVFYENQPFWLSDNALGVKAKEISYEKFLYYKLVSMKLNSHAIGGAQPLLTQTLLKELEINLPPLPEQKAIADMLSSFDEKIELLREQNKTLEALAQTIFKEWFVHFNFPDQHGKLYRKNGGEMVESELGEIPKGWRVERLGEALEVKRGGSPRPIQDYLSNSGYRWLKISDATATSSPFIFEIKEHIKKEGLKKTTLLKKGSLVLSNSATPGVPKFLELDSCIHDGWLHFPSTNIFSYHYLYLFFQHIRKPLLQQGNGSVFKNLKTDILKGWMMVVPDIETMNNFNELILPVFEKIKNNASQVQSLSRTRDTLLPKLMNGKVRL